MGTLQVGGTTLGVKNTSTNKVDLSNVGDLTVADGGSVSGVMKRATEVALSGTGTTFNNIPSGVNTIIISFYDVSLNGTGNIKVLIGDSEGIESSGYEAVGGYFGGATYSENYTNSFPITLQGAGRKISGNMILTNVGSNRWISSHSGYIDTNKIAGGGGSKTLSSTLTQVQILAGGSDNFDAGYVNILYTG